MAKPLVQLAALLLGALTATAPAQQGGQPPAKAPPPKAATADKPAGADKPAAETFAFDEEQPLVGQWAGQLQVAPDQKTVCALRVTAGADGDLAGQLVHVYGASPCTTFGVEQRKLTLKVALGSRELALTAELAADGQSLAGQATLTDKGKPGEPFGVTLRREPRAAALPGARAWSGTLTIEGKGDVPFSLVLGSTPGGRLVAEVDIPAFKLVEAPLVGVKRTGAELAATWPAKPPVTLALTFGADDATLAGEAKLPGMINPVKLELDEALLAQRIAAAAPASGPSR